MEKSDVENYLKQKITVDHFEMVDDSAKHAGHAGAKQGGGHFQILVVSKNFENLPLQKRHRLIHEALKEKFVKEIHALSIRALTPQEYNV